MVVPAELADALGNVVGHRKDLGRMVVEQKMVVAEVRAAHVPMKVLGLQVKGEDIGKERVKGRGDVLHRFRVDIGWCVQGCFLPCDKFSCFCHSNPLVDLVRFV